MQRHPAPPSTLQLQAGETCHVYLAAGDSLHASAGPVTFRGPGVWLGERIASCSTRVAGGESHTAADSGWAAITAGGHGAVIHITPPGRRQPARMAAFTGLRQLAAALARLFPTSPVRTESP